MANRAQYIEERFEFKLKSSHHHSEEDTKGIYQSLSLSALMSYYLYGDILSSPACTQATQIAIWKQHQGESNLFTLIVRVNE